MLCTLILYVSAGTYRFLRNFFGADLFTVRAFAWNLLSGNRRRNILSFHISFWCLIWNTNPVFSSNKPIYYLLDYGDTEIFYHIFVLMFYMGFESWRNLLLFIYYIYYIYTIYYTAAHKSPKANISSWITQLPFFYKILNPLVNPLHSL